MKFIQAVVATALGGIIVVVVIELCKLCKIVLSERPVAKHRHKLNWRRALRNFLIAFICIFATDLTPMPVGETIRVAIFGAPAQNERWTLDAWRAFERRDYLAAIASAEQVIDQYAGVAERRQAELGRQKEAPPPVGKVTPWAAAKSFRRGLLNDVASCYWIAGQSHEKIGHGCEAKAAYIAASKLTYARTWDPQWWPLRGWSPFGWFWSPASVAQDRVSMVSCP